MTRFARAKGSKSSNEKKPEDATPWSELKNSMVSKNTNQPEKPTLQKEMKLNGSKETEWASLGDDFSNSVSLIKQHLSKKDKKLKNSDSSSCVETKTHKKKRERDNFQNEENIIINEPKKKKQKKNLNSAVAPEIKELNLKKNKKRKLTENEIDQDVSIAKKKKFPKTEKEFSKNESKQNKNTNNFQKNNRTKLQSFQKNNFKPQTDKRFSEQTKKKKKIKNKERKPEVEELIINGEKIRIVKFQGFNVTLEDAERLKNLRNEMIKEGIPKAKLEAAIKLERRRAEKALSRLKKSVCFHCRSRGHLLSNCPELIEKEDTGTGICYKCGSTEHSAVECKVVHGTQYQYAECFICKEQGHIARQCPDNPRGLYPHGGACRECGDVTHLRKDCPQIQIQKAEETITVGLRNDRNLECLDEEITNRKTENSHKKVKKQRTVKF